MRSDDEKNTKRRATTERTPSTRGDGERNTMTRKNGLATKLIAAVTSVVLAVGLTALPAFAASDGAETVTPSSETYAAPTDEGATSNTSSQPLTIGAYGAQGTDGALAEGLETQEDGVNSWFLLKLIAEAANGGETIKLSGDAINRSGKSDRIQIKKSITIDLAGHKVNRGLTSVTNNGHVFEVFSGATLTIQDSSSGKTGQITGGYSKRGGGIYINTG